MNGTDKPQSHDGTLQGPGTLHGSDAWRQQARRARPDVACGRLRGAALLEHLLAVPFCERDGWIDALLGFEGQEPQDAPDLPRGAVPYLPCGVDEILALVREVPLGPGTALVDLGSGLGRVAILAHLLCGAPALGIEIQAHLVALARARCAALAVHQVAFEHANAAETELAGRVFFLYAPFNGPMLTAVLGRLEALARRQPITVCAVAIDLRGAPWLQPRSPASAAVSLYDSSLGGHGAGDGQTLV